MKYFQSAFFVSLVLLTSWLPASSYAQTIANDKAFSGFMANVTGANQQTVNFASNGTATLSTASGNLTASTSGTVQIAGRPLPISVSAKASGLAVGALFKKSFGLVPFLGTGIALYEMANELGYLVSRNPVGDLVVNKIDSALCTVAPCYEYSINPDGGSPYMRGPSATAICTAWAPLYYANVAATLSKYSSNTNSTCYLELCTRSTGECWRTVAVRIDSHFATPAPSNLVPKTLDDLANEIAAKSGWPSNSRLPQAVTDAVALTGDPLPFQEQKTITGPATRQDEQTVKSNPDGTTTTTTKTQNITYSGDTITNNTTNVTSIYSPTTNTTQTTTETTTKPQNPEPVETCGLPGKPQCNVKVDESGTKTAVTESEFLSKADNLRPSKEAAIQRIVAPTDTGSFFSGWNVFWGAPAVVACAPIVLPVRLGVSMGSLNPCPVVNGMREVMAYIWAAAGLFLCLGMVRQTAQGA